MRDIAKKLGLEDLGIYQNHKCACGADVRRGKDAQDRIWSWCPTCKCVLKVISIPRFSKSSFVPREPHDD